jgi:hypothetical protein
LGISLGELAMDAFESLVAMLLHHEGYWTTRSFKVELTKAEKREVGLPSTPRWEIDVLAYKGSTNEILAVECKSFLDSTGVKFRNGRFEPEHRYKLFSNDELRAVVFRRLLEQLVRKRGSCASNPKVILCLAVGKLAGITKENELRKHFEKNNWRLFGPKWIGDKLAAAAEMGYENDIAVVVSKILRYNRLQ